MQKVKGTNSILVSSAVIIMRLVKGFKPKQNLYSFSFGYFMNIFQDKENCNIVIQLPLCVIHNISTISKEIIYQESVKDNNSLVFGKCMTRLIAIIND